MQRPENTPIGIVGAGMIGCDQAALCMGYGYEVVVLVRSAEKAQQARKKIEADYDMLVQHHVISPADKQRYLTRVHFTQDYADLACCRVVFEAVAEQIPVKQTVFAALEQVCAADAVILSQSSSIAPEALYGTMGHPERLLVAHPWNPAYLVPMVELVRGEKTSDAAALRAKQLLESMDREVVTLQKSVPGFIGNRIMHAMFREALELIDMGVATAQDIDKVIYYGFGQRYASIGLMEFYDAVGLDLQHDIDTGLFPALSTAQAPQAPLMERYARGELGAKTGKGFYDWTPERQADFDWRKTKPFLQYGHWEKAEP